MEAEVHGLVLGFDYTYIIRELLIELLGRKVTEEAYVDRKTLLNAV